MKIWRMLVAICMIGAMVFTFAACGGTEATEPTTEAATEAATDAADATTESEPLIKPETFKAFAGTWYADGSSASYRLIINADATWVFNDAIGEAMFAGTLFVTEENVAVTLYDPDGVQVLDLKLEEAGKLYVESYVESLTENLVSNYFLNTITNDVAIETPIIDEEHSATAPEEEAASAGDFSESIEEVPNADEEPAA